MKKLKIITILLIIVSLILVAFDLVTVQSLVCSWFIWILVIFVSHFLILDMEKVIGQIKFFGNQNMVLHNGTLYDYRFHKKFDEQDLITEGDRIVGYIEDNIFVITDVVD
jgi:hypothetical protein